MPNTNKCASSKKGDVRIEHLVKMFGDVVAVNDVSIEIKQGEFLTLLGPSGSGKTTILNMIAGFQIPSKGMIYIADEPIVTKSPEDRNIGMVFQQYALFPHKTVFENIAFPLRMRGIDKKETLGKVYGALSMVKLEEFWNRYPKQLSGGQQQRIALARSLVFNPAVLLMDEPLGALDKKLRDHMQIEIKNLVRSLNITVIYVTHDQQEALTMSDRIAVLNEGKIEQLASPEYIYENPVNSFVADFIGESNLMEGVAKRIDGETCSITLPKGLELKSVRTKEVTLNQKVTFSIRPEKIFFSSETKQFGNTCEGTIVEIVYLGNVTKYRLKLRGEDYSLNITQQTFSRMSKHSKGETVSVFCYPEDIKILS